jgi:uncharacterized protein YdbL (DUF1318 family)
MKKSVLLLPFVALSFAFSAFALDLTAAKSQGLVGETASGYLGAVENNAEIQALIDDINAKRKAKYEQLAEKHGITLAQVEQQAGKKALQKTEKGHFVQVNGKWVKK